MENRVAAANRSEWRKWLEQHHADANEAWLVYYKKHTGKPSVSYPESVEEAICFGWIDGIRKRIDEERYCHRFSPRRKGSQWSSLNIARAEKLIRQERMAAAGLACFEQREKHGEAIPRDRERAAAQLTPEMERSLRANPPAWQNFRQLAPGYQRQYTAWLTTAKKPETRAKRLAEAIHLLQQNLKLGMT